MRSNNWYLLKYWLMSVLIFLFMTAALAVNVLQSEYTVALIILASFLITAIIYYLFRKEAYDAASKYYKEQSPDKLIEYARRRINPNLIAHGDAMLAFNVASAQCVFGQFDEALDTMGRVDWATKPPLLQAHDLLLKALAIYLQHGDYAEGLMLSKEAQELSRIPTGLPGSKQTREGLELYVEIGQILTGSSNQEIINKLERQFYKPSRIPKLLLAWALANAYKKAGLTEKTNVMLDYCKTNAPYCKPLHRLTSITR